MEWWWYRYGDDGVHAFTLFCLFIIAFLFVTHFLLHRHPVRLLLAVFCVFFIIVAWIFVIVSPCIHYGNNNNIVCFCGKNWLYHRKAEERKRETERKSKSIFLMRTSYFLYVTTTNNGSKTSWDRLQSKLCKKLREGIIFGRGDDAMPFLGSCRSTIHERRQKRLLKSTCFFCQSMSLLAIFRIHPCCYQSAMKTILFTISLLFGM